MLQPRTGDATGYWLQLAIATMLATLGLALSSTAVVIGAMLIAPLMRPLVELAMGLATGSAGLVLRAAIRTLASIVLVTLVAVAITWLLPFHEITAELEARTAPSLLDLAVAGACALAAAYASLRADADIATTAAGTSIGISLVPPLCAAGYGLAIGNEGVARGAALLFTANLSGILVLATLVFAIVGFARVDIRAEESTLDEAERVGRSLRLGRAWSTLVATRLGPLARIVPPLVLLGIVYIPLQRAVDEIRYRNEIRQTVSTLLATDTRRVVQYSLDQTSSGVHLRVIVVGDGPFASVLEKELREHLAALDVTDPKLSVWAVPEAASVSALATRVDAIPPPLVPEPAPQVARRHTSNIVDAIRGAWPKSGTGELVGIWHDLDHPLRIRLIHLGEPIGIAGVQLLARAVTVVDSLELEEDALLPIEAPAEDGPLWLPKALDQVAKSRRATGLQLCVTIPEEPKPLPRKPALPPEVKALRAAIIGMLPQTPTPTVSGNLWRIVPQQQPCANSLAPVPVVP
jgi:uncharacterized hydrophobic protein (TIGR00271 family)